MPRPFRNAAFSFTQKIICHNYRRIKPDKIIFQLYHYNDTHKRTRTIIPSSLSNKANHRILTFLFLLRYGKIRYDVYARSTYIHILIFQS